MLKVDSLELFLYLFPLLEIVLIHLFFKPYIQYQPYFKLSVTDVLVPLLLVGIHILSVRIFTYSLLPAFLFVSFLIGLGILFYFDIRKKKNADRKIFSLFLKVSFLAGFVLYYGLVIVRITYIFKT